MAENTSRATAAVSDGPCAPSLYHLAVVVPVYNEEDNVAPLIGEIESALNGVCAFQIVYVDDGSADGTARTLSEQARRLDNLTVIRHRTCCGQSAAVATGVAAARASIIATLDGDGQNDPNDIPNLLKVLESDDDPDALLIAGWRAKRKDTWSKRMQSKIANAVRARLLKDDTPDTGCGLKVFTRAAFLDMPRFDHMHRFLPALMIRRGGRVRSVEVNHRPRERGQSKYGLWGRLKVGIVDIFGVNWLIRRGSKPVIERIEGPRS